MPSAESATRQVGNEPGTGGTSADPGPCGGSGWSVATRLWLYAGPPTSGHHVQEAHHAVVLVGSDVAVEHPAAGEIVDRDADHYLARDAAHRVRHRDDVLHVRVRHRGPVHRHHLEAAGVQVERMVLAALVEDGPFLDRSEVRGVGEDGRVRIELIT